MKTSPSMTLALALVLASNVSAQDFGTIELKAKSGDPVPGTTQSLRLNSDAPRITSNGIIWFYAETQQDTNTTSLFSLSGQTQTALGRHISERQATPDNDGRVGNLSLFGTRVYSTDNGTLMPLVFLENITTAGSSALYRTTNAQGLTEVLRNGKSFAAAQPPICRTNGIGNSSVHVERNGDIWFVPNVAVSSTNCDRRSVIRLTNSGAVAAIANLGSSVQGTAHTLTDLWGEVLGNGQGGIFFRGRDTSSSSSFWYLIRGTAVLRIAPSTSSDVYAGASETLTIIAANTVTQYRSGSMSGIELIRRGQNLPQGQGQFFSIRDADVSSDNVVVATMELTGTVGGTSDDSGLYLVDSQGVVEIAREGRPAIAPNSTFTAIPNSTELATVGPGGRVRFEATYRVGASSFTGWFYYDRQFGLREFLNATTSVQGAVVQSVRMGDRFNERGEIPMQVSLNNNTVQIALFRLPGTAPPPPPPIFAISPGISGTWFDPQQSGHGLLVEVLPANQILAWWFTFDAQGNQAWFGGVGPYVGNTATIPFARTAGGRFIPNFNPAQVTNPPWGTVTLRFTNCNQGRVEFSSQMPGFGTGSMNLQRLTLPAGLSCP